MIGTLREGKADCPSWVHEVVQVRRRNCFSYTLYFPFSPAIYILVKTFTSSLPSPHPLPTSVWPSPQPPPPLSLSLSLSSQPERKIFCQRLCHVMSLFTTLWRMPAKLIRPLGPFRVCTTHSFMYHLSFHGVYIYNHVHVISVLKAGHVEHLPQCIVFIICGFQYLSLFLTE